MVEEECVLKIVYLMDSDHVLCWQSVDKIMLEYQFEVICFMGFKCSCFMLLDNNCYDSRCHQRWVNLLLVLNKHLFGERHSLSYWLYLHIDFPTWHLFNNERTWLKDRKCPLQMPKITFWFLFAAIVLVGMDLVIYVPIFLEGQNPPRFGLLNCQLSDDGWTQSHIIVICWSAPGTTSLWKYVMQW